MLLLLLNYVVLRALWKIDVHLISARVNKSRKSTSHQPLTIHEPKLNTQVMCHDNTQVIGLDNTQVMGHDNTQVMGHDNTQVMGHDNTQVIGHDNTQVMGHDTCNTICGFIIVSFVFQWRRSTKAKTYFLVVYLNLMLPVYPQICIQHR